MKNASTLALHVAILLLVACGDDSTTVDGGGADGGDAMVDPNDLDGDGLSNEVEENGWEISVDRVGLGMAVVSVVTSDPTNPDTDGDGLTDAEEFQRTDPNLPDTDGDGLTDADEVNVYLSIATSVDTDGDSVSGATSNMQLWDGDEVNRWGTSPSLSDTDGDNRSDFDEIINNATNPLVAQVPSVALEFAGEIDVRLNIEYEDAVGVMEEYGSSYSLATSDSRSATDTVSATRSVENTRTISAEVEAGLPPGVTVTATLSETVGYSNENSASLTNGSARMAQSEFQRARNESSLRTERTSEGSLSMGITIANPSEIAYSLTNLAVSVLQFDSEASSFRTVATLTPELESFNLAPGERRAVPNQIAATGVNAGLIREFLRQPRSLYFAVSNFDMENAEGINYAFLRETTNARTGRIVIDFGDGTVEDFRVATNVRRNPDGSLAGVPLSTVFEEYLEIPFETAAWDGDIPDKQGVQVLTRIRDTETSTTAGEAGFWAVFTDVADVDGSYRDFGDTVLQRGEALHIAYLRDRDGDGVYDREETFYSTSDEDEDSDDDGLTDFEEIRTGWLTIGDDPRMVFSDPTTADADDDGLSDLEERDGGTDPNVRDSQPPVIELTTSLDGALTTLSGSITGTVPDPVGAVTIDWGDGFSEELTVPAATTDLPVDSSHGYLSPGMYTITVTALNDTGGEGVFTDMVTTEVPYARAYYALEGGFTDSVGGRNALVTQVGSAGIGFMTGRAAFTQSFRFNNDAGATHWAYATVPSFGSIPTDNFTIAFWTDGGGSHMVSQNDRVAVGFQSEVVVRIGDMDMLVEGTATARTEWKFIVVTKEGNELSLYLNGELDRSVTLPPLTYGPCTSLFINGDASGMQCEEQDFVGAESTFHSSKMDDIRIFDRAINAGDVRALYEEGGYTP